MRFKHFINEEKVGKFNVVERKYSNDDSLLSVGIGNIHAMVPNVEGNKNKISEAISIMKGRGANVILFPEFCLAGYFWDNTPEEQGDPACWEYMDTAVTDKHWDWVRSDIEGQLDDQLKFVMFNNIRKGPEKKYYNSTYIINKALDYKDPKWIYDKTFLPGIENVYTISGKTDRVVLDTDWGRFGFSTCYDFSFAQLYQEMARIDEVDAVFQLSSWRGTSERNYPGMNVYTDTYYGDLWDMLMGGTAARNQIWVIACNAVGEHAISKALFWGGSGVWAPSGLEMYQGSKRDDELMVIHNIDIKGQVKAEKDDFDYSKDFEKIYTKIEGRRSFTRM